MPHTVRVQCKVVMIILLSLIEIPGTVLDFECRLGPSHVRASGLRRTRGVFVGEDSFLDPSMTVVWKVKVAAAVGGL